MPVYQIIIYIQGIAKFIRPGVFVFSIRIWIQINTGTEVFVFKYLHKIRKVFIFEYLPKVFCIHEYFDECFSQFTPKWSQHKLEVVLGYTTQRSLQEKGGTWDIMADLCDWNHWIRRMIINIWDWFKNAYQLIFCIHERIHEYFQKHFHSYLNIN